MANATPHLVRQISVHALVDPRTVERYLSDATVKPLSAMRIETALHELGRDDLIRTEVRRTG